MSCNRMFEAICDIYSSQYGNCSDRNVCLVDLLGEELILEKCKNCGLDVEYNEVYYDILNRINKNKI